MFNEKFSSPIWGDWGLPSPLFEGVVFVISHDASLLGFSLENAGEELKSWAHEKENHFLPSLNRHTCHNLIFYCKINGTFLPSISCLTVSNIGDDQEFVEFHQTCCKAKTHDND